MTDVTEAPPGPSTYLRDGLTALAADLRTRAENEQAIAADQQFKANARRGEIGELDKAEAEVTARIAELQRKLDQDRATRKESRLLLADAEQRAALAGEAATKLAHDADWANAEAARLTRAAEPLPPAEAIASAGLPATDPLAAAPGVVDSRREQVAAPTGAHPVPDEAAVRAHVEALTSGAPLTTLTDRGGLLDQPAPDNTGARHRGVTAPLKVLTGLGRPAGQQDGDQT